MTVVGVAPDVVLQSRDDAAAQILRLVPGDALEAAAIGGVAAGMAWRALSIDPSQALRPD